jgi:signal transduction histidine kinase
MTDPGGDMHQSEALSPHSGKMQGVTGPLLTIVLAGMLFWLRDLDVHVPNPVLFFANVIVFSAFLGGVWAGLASVAITLVFALLYWSVPGQPLQYSTVDLERLAVLALTMPPLGGLVGWLRAAYDRKQRALVKQNAQLADELQRRVALEERQRDVEHILRHDLRSPLNGIITIPQLLQDDDNLTAQQREMLAMVATAGRKMLSQINSSLELRKIEDGSYTLQLQSCDPARILKDNFKILAMSGYKDKPTFTFTEHVPVILETDCRLLDVVVENLLGNALEASDPGSPVVVESGEEMGDCVITIANNQPVPEEVRQRFFEKYVTAGKAGGTGLGTYSARLMTHAIGGSLTMETSEQDGTKVMIRIPLGKA